MTKKNFKELVFDTVYSGGGRKFYAMFFDWKEGFGYKFMVFSDVRNIRKKELFDLLYNWVTDSEHDNDNFPYYVNCKYAEIDQMRFKVPLSLRNL